MNNFEERYGNHQIHQTLSTLHSNIDSNEPELPDEGPVKDTFERLKAVIAYADSLIKSIDPYLVTQQALDQLNSHLNNINGSFNNFRSKKNWSDLSNNCDNLLNHFYLLPRRNPKQGELEFGDAISHFRTDSSAALKDLTDCRVKIEGEFESINEKIKSFDSELEEQKSLFEAQKGRLDQLITEEQARFNSSEQVRQGEHSSKEKERQDEFDGLVSDQVSKFGVLINDLKTQAQEGENKLKEDAKALLKILEENCERAKGIVGLIGNTGMTGHFQKVANREWWSAEILRGIGILFMVGMVVLVWMVVKEIKAEDFNWEVALFRVAVALALVWPAWFCGHESQRHREIENRNRRIELELASIDPYLERLDDSEARKIIVKLADRYFGNGEVENPQKEIASISEKQKGELKGLLEALLKSLNR